MCGIVGYLGGQAAVPVLLYGLQKLTYRGYDSAGIAVLENGGILVKKQAGKLAVLQEELKDISFQARVGIGHTRWATHGRPSTINAHPHLDCSGCFAVVHNGIIENYLELKEWLIAQGHTFSSETDTEVLPHLVEHYYRGSLELAVHQAISRVEGSYAMVVLTVHEPDYLVALRQDSPLIVGLGENENFIASDVPALLKYTRQTRIPSDGEMVIVTPERVEIKDHRLKSVQKPIFEVKWEEAQAEKGGFTHFMLKEIYEQPQAIQETLRGRLAADSIKVTLGELPLAGVKKMFITACGTAYHAGLVGKYIIEKLARLPVEVELASEFRYRQPLITPETLVLIISQSGETADTLGALREAKKMGAPVVAVTNVVGSSVTREADFNLYTWAGPEIAVASTKAYTTQLITMYLLALYLADKQKTLPAEEIQNLIKELKLLSQKATEVLPKAARFNQELADRYAQKENIFFIGRGLDYTVAMEGALKLKEISYIHAEAYAAGELKHGTLALITDGVPVVALVTQKALLEKTISNIKEVKTREATVITFAATGLKEVEEVSDHVFYLPQTHPLLSSVLAVIPLQLLAYYMAVARGCDVDQPRNLAKSVTVE